MRIRLKMSFQIDLSKATSMGLIFILYFQQSICSSSLRKPSGELIKCGELCEYVDRCLNSDYYNESDFMLAVCDLMIQDIMHATDDLKILQMAPRYMRQFHKYDSNEHLKRNKRHSRTNKVLTQYI